MTKFFLGKMAGKSKLRIGVLLLVISVSLNMPGLIWLYWNNAHRVEIERAIIENSLDNVKGVSNSKKRIIVGDPIDVLKLPLKISSWNLLEEEWSWFFRDKGVSYPLLYQGHNVSSVRLSPSHTKLGFFFYPEGHFLNKIILAVLDINQKVVSEVYNGDTWISNWEWKGDDAVIVKRSCGTGCMSAYIINAFTGEKTDHYRVY